MTRLEDIFEKEFIKLKTIDTINQNFLLEHENQLKKVFGFVFSINYLRNRVETKKYFSKDYNKAFSLLLETTYSLLSGQCRSALLLLRASQEANYRFVLEREREFINSIDSSVTFQPLNYRFVETKQKFMSDLQPYVDPEDFKEYYLSIERNLTLYKKLSGIAHLGTQNEPVVSVEYFSHLYEDTLINKSEYFNLFNSVLREMFIIIFYMVRQSLNKWDTYVLYDLLNIMFGKKKSETLINTIKK